MGRLSRNPGGHNFRDVQIHLLFPFMMQGVYRIPYIVLFRGFPESALRPLNSLHRSCGMLTFRRRRRRNSFFPLGLGGRGSAGTGRRLRRLRSVFLLRCRPQGGRRLGLLRRLFNSPKTKAVFTPRTSGKFRARGNFALIYAAGMFTMRTTDNHWGMSRLLPWLDEKQS